MRLHHRVAFSGSNNLVCPACRHPSAGTSNQERALAMIFRRLSGLGPVAQGASYYFGLYAASAAYLPFLTVSFARRGLSGAEIGLLAAVGPLMALLVAPTLSALADRGGQ